MHPSLISGVFGLGLSNQRRDIRLIQAPLLPCTLETLDIHGLAPKSPKKNYK